MAAVCMVPEQEWEINPFCLHGIRKHHKKEKLCSSEIITACSQHGKVRIGFCAQPCLVCWELFHSMEFSVQILPLWATQYWKPLREDYSVSGGSCWISTVRWLLENVNFDSKGRTTSLRPTRSSARHLHLTQSSSSGSKNPINPTNPTLHLSGLIWFYY